MELELPIEILIGSFMSFTSDVREELCKKTINNTHCRVAEIAALISSCSDIIISIDNEYQLVFKTDTNITAQRFVDLVAKTFKITPQITQKDNQLSRTKHTFFVTIDNDEDTRKVLRRINIVDKNDEMRENLSVNHNEIIERDCCKRAYLRGAFIANGSVSDPNKDYHLEINCPTEDKATQIKNLMAAFGIASNILNRKDNFMVYIKEGEGIGDFLKVIGASVAVMELENIRILKDMSNYYNRQTNCDAANIKKTVTTARRQIDNIQYIIDEVGIDYLPDKLQHIAQMRLDNPEMSLQELGESMNPPLGKSGVNHRLRKINEIAEKLRNEEV